VVGVGPSARYAAEMPRDGLRVYGVNDVEKFLTPTDLVVVDGWKQWRRLKHRWPDVARTKAGRVWVTDAVLGAHLGLAVSRFETYHILTLRDKADWSMDETRWDPESQSEIPVLPGYYTSTFPVCIMAYQHGATRIGLIGCDFDKHNLTPVATKIDEMYGVLCSKMQEKGVELVNLSAQSVLESLPVVSPRRWLEESWAVQA
tara:strand:+ start:190 stop:795 length:606 start_codon:yes stop_codon:yes gene_type:complete